MYTDMDQNGIKQKRHTKHKPESIKITIIATGT